jgi:hypothetical protein
MNPLFSKALFLFLFLFISAGVFAQAPTAQKLEEAISTLRNITWEGWSDDQKEAKAQQIDEAWKFLISTGPKASIRLKQEIDKVNAGKEKDEPIQNSLKLTRT